MTFDYVAVLPAAIASWIVGAIWYAVWGRPWRLALGWTDVDAEKTMPLAPMITSFVAEIIMALLLTGLIAHFGDPSPRTGLIIGAACWLAFVVTTITVNNGFQRRPLMLTVIDSGHWLAVLLVQGLVIGLLG